MLTQGLPRAIASRFGEGTKNGRFEFVALFPIEPRSEWFPGTPEVDGVLQVVDYVVRRHRIDPDRVYLTGVSAGGSGVWRLAETYPDRWAAVAPLSSFEVPVVERVKHIPAWIFHGAKDARAKVDPRRAIVDQLQKAGGDVRYSENATKGHNITGEAYNARPLFDWLSAKRRVTR